MRTAFFCVITCLLGLSIGLMINVGVVGDTLFPSHPVQGNVNISTPQRTVPKEEAPNTNSSKNNQVELPGTQTERDQAVLLRRSYEVLAALKAQDLPALSALVHPSKGVRLTPYSTVNNASDLVLTSSDLNKAKDNTSTRVWGLYNGSGLPIELSVPDYFRQFVYNADYASAPMMGVNTVLSYGNSLENVSESYPEAEFVEFHFPGIDPKNEGFDWCGLKLVFETVSNEYRLVGLIHSEWTV